MENISSFLTEIAHKIIQLDAAKKNSYLEDNVHFRILAHWRSQAGERLRSRDYRERHSWSKHSVRRCIRVLDSKWDILCALFYLQIIFEGTGNGRDVRTAWMLDLENQFFWNMRCTCDCFGYLIGSFVQRVSILIVSLILLLLEQNININILRQLITSIHFTNDSSSCVCGKSHSPRDL